MKLIKQHREISYKLRMLENRMNWYERYLAKTNDCNNLTEEEFNTILSNVPNSVIDNSFITALDSYYRADMTQPRNIRSFRIGKNKFLVAKE